MLGVLNNGQLWLGSIGIGRDIRQAFRASTRPCARTLGTDRLLVTVVREAM